MSLQSSAEPSRAPTTIRGKFQQRGAGNCTFGAVAKTIWPHKTAFELAARTGASERTAKYWLAGRYEPSAAAAAAIINELFGHAH